MSSYLQGACAGCVLLAAFAAVGSPRRRADQAFVPGDRRGNLHPRRRRQGRVALPGGHARRLGAAQRRRAAGRDEEQGLPRRRGRRGDARRQGGVRVQGHAVGGQHRPAARRRPDPAHGGRRQAAPAGGGPRGQDRRGSAVAGADEGPPFADAHGPQAGQRQLPRAAALGPGGARVHAGRQDRVGSEDAEHAVHGHPPGQRQHAHRLHARQPRPSRWTRRAKRSGS